MADEILNRDPNHVPVAGAITNDANEDTRMWRIDDITKGIKVAVVGGVGVGDVFGPASSTDNAVARFDGTGGKTIQNSGIIIDDSNNISGLNLTQGSILFTGSSGAISQNNTNFFWDNTNNRLGIGNNSPTVALDVTGAIKASISLTVPLLIGGTTTTSTLSLRSTSGVGTTGADIIFQTGNNGATEAMRILNSGNVGIGTVTPQTQFSVVRNNNALTTPATISLGDSDTSITAGQVTGVVEFSSTNETSLSGVYTPLVQIKGIAPTTITGSASADGQLSVFLARGVSGLVESMVLTMPGQLQVPTTGSNAGLLLGGDAQWYRGAANRMTLATGDSLALTDMTTGSVLFAAASGVVTQDNSNFFWDDTNNFLGLGTASPNTRLTVSPPTTPTGSASTYMSHINAASATIAFATTPQSGDFIANHLQEATLTNPSAGTIPNASTLKLDGAPIASTNVTITNPYTIWSAAGLNRFDGSTVIGALAQPDTLLHVFNGSAGTVTAGVDTVAVFENNATCRILILSPSANSGVINFGDPASTTVGQVTYDHSSDELSFRIGGTSNVCNWKTTTMTFKDTFNIVVGSTNGTKIATATTQKIGFWNATPIVQPAAVGTYTNTGIYATDAAGIKTAIDGLRAVLSAALGGSGLTA